MQVKTIGGIHFNVDAIKKMKLTDFKKGHEKVLAKRNLDAGEVFKQLTGSKEKED